MKIAAFFAGVLSTVTKEAAVLVTDVAGVFDKTKATVQAVPFLPANLKGDLSQTLDDAKADVIGLAGLAGSLTGNVIADGVGDVTTLFYNTVNALTNSRSVADFSTAEKTAVAQTWTVMKAQGDTLLAQFLAGVDPVAAQAAAAKAAQPVPPPLVTEPATGPSMGG